MKFLLLLTLFKSVKFECSCFDTHYYTKIIIKIVKESILETEASASVVKEAENDKNSNFFAIRIVEKKRLKSKFNVNS